MSGWPSILILALAYGVFEEGIATMSLFNPNYVGLRLLDSGYIPSLGMGAPWTVLVLTLHVVWSIGVPVALVELRRAHAHRGGGEKNPASQGALRIRPCAAHLSGVRRRAVDGVSTALRRRRARPNVANAPGGLNRAARRTTMPTSSA